MQKLILYLLYLVYLLYLLYLLPEYHQHITVWLPVWVQTFQFPVKVCLAMIINKAQGQSLK
jgi:hypothetical protein